jgi:hypothetical protein
LILHSSFYQILVKVHSKCCIKAKRNRDIYTQTNSYVLNECIPNALVPVHVPTLIVEREVFCVHMQRVDVV